MVQPTTWINFVSGSEPMDVDSGERAAAAGGAAAVRSAAVRSAAVRSAAVRSAAGEPVRTEDAGEPRASDGSEVANSGESLTRHWKELSVPAFLMDLGILLLPLLGAWFAFSDLQGWPHNDDPFYGKSVQWAVEDGRFELARQRGVLSASTATHVLAGIGVCSLIGFSYRGLFLACIIQQWLGAAAVYGIGRAVRLDRGWCLLLGLSLLLNPLYFGHAFTFMTDGPGAAWIAIALFFGVMAFTQRDSRWLWVCSLAVGWGFWMRQTNLIVVGAPLAAGCVLALLKRPVFPLKPLFTALLIVPGVALLLLESGLIVERNADDIGLLAYTLSGAAWVKQVAVFTYGWALMLGLIGLPFAPVLFVTILNARRQLSTGTRRFADGLGVLAAGGPLAVFAVTAGRTYITNSTGMFIQNAHFGPVLLSDFDEPGRWGDLCGITWPELFWQLLTLSAIFSLGLMAWWLGWTFIRWKQSTQERGESEVVLSVSLGMLASALVLSLVYLLIVDPSVDRYWLSLIPAIYGWIAITLAHFDRRPGRLSVMSCCVLLVGFLAWDAVFVHDHLAWNNARWKQFSLWIEQGSEPRQIDGGIEANAWMRLDEDPRSMNREGDDSKSWSGFATRSIATGPRVGWEEVGRLPWRSWASGQREELLILRKSSRAAE